MSLPPFNLASKLCIKSTSIRFEHEAAVSVSVRRQSEVTTGNRWPHLLLKNLKIDHVSVHGSVFVDRRDTHAQTFIMFTWARPR